MRPGQFAALAVRILALYCFVSSLPGFLKAFIVLGYYLNLLTPSSGGMSVEWGFDYNLWSVVIVALPTLLTVGFGILLWIFAEAIALMMVRAENEESQVFPHLDSFAVHVIAFSTVGIVLILRAFPVAVQFVYEAFDASHHSYVFGLTNLEGSQIFTVIAQTIFGLWLLFGAKGIVKGIRSLRDIGRDPNL